MAEWPYPCACGLSLGCQAGDGRGAGSSPHCPGSLSPSDPLLGACGGFWSHRSRAARGWWWVAGLGAEGSPLQSVPVPAAPSLLPPPRRCTGTPCPGSGPQSSPAGSGSRPYAPWARAWRADGECVLNRTRSLPGAFLLLFLRPPFYSLLWERPAHPEGHSPLLQPGPRGAARAALLRAPTPLPQPGLMREGERRGSETSPALHLDRAAPTSGLSRQSNGSQAFPSRNAIGFLQRASKSCSHHQDQHQCGRSSSPSPAPSASLSNPSGVSAVRQRPQDLGSSQQSWATGRKLGCAKIGTAVSPWATFSTSLCLAPGWLRA